MTHLILARSKAKSEEPETKQETMTKIEIDSLLHGGGVGCGLYHCADWHTQQRARQPDPVLPFSSLLFLVFPLPSSSCLASSCLVLSSPPRRLTGRPLQADGHGDFTCFAQLGQEGGYPPHVLEGRRVRGKRPHEAGDARRRDARKRQRSPSGAPNFRSRSPTRGV